MNKKCFRSMMAAPCLLLAAALSRPASTVHAQAAAGADGRYQEYFDRVIPQQLESLHIAGAAVTVVEGGEVVFTKGYGFADVENGIAVQPDRTLFRIGSVSKLFTWTAVMQQVEQSKLDLDADVNAYLDFQIPDTYPQPVTLRRLLTHTAGFEDRVAGFEALTPEKMIPLGAWLASHIPARVRTPGEISSYSNYGAALAGYIVERVSGMPFEEYLERNILMPLGLQRTTIHQPLPEGWAAELSNGYVYSAGQFAKMDFESIVPFPAGGMTSTAADMARFLSAYLQGGEFQGARILQEKTALQMQSRLFGNVPGGNGWAYGFYEMSRNGVRVVGHCGDTRLFHTLAAIIPEKNLGIFAAYNSENAFDVHSLLLEDFLDAFFPADASEPSRVTLSPAELAKFAGSYRQTQYLAQTTLEKAANLLQPVIMQPTVDGGLLLSSASYGVYTLIPVEPMVFAAKDDPQNALIFREDASSQGLRAFLSSDPTVVFERLPWYGDYTLHYIILTGAVLLFLSALAAAFIRWIIGRIRKQPDASLRPAILGRRVFNLMALVGVLFPVGFVLAFNGIVYDELGLLNIVLALPILLTGLSIAAGYFIIRAWREKHGRAAERIFNLLLLVASLGFLWSLNYWNLLGWKY
jgi:CubicO group peptidase (beta-lactamase class C family)